MQSLADHFPPVQHLREDTDDLEVAVHYRHENGGHLLFRPIGLLLIARVIRRLMDNGEAVDRATRRVSNAPMDLAEFPWAGLLWDVRNGRMITQSANQKAAEKLLFYALGGELSEMRSSPEILKQELAGLLNVEIDGVELPRYTEPYSQSDQSR